MLNTLPLGGTRTIGTGYTHVYWKDVDVNDAAVKLDAIDLFELADTYGLRQKASVQVVGKTGSAATRVVKLRWSNDGVAYSDVGSVAGGATHTADLDVKSRRYLRCEVTTAEGSAATADIHLVLTGDYR